MNERILITGGTGLLGSYLIRWFRHLGYTNITSTYRRSLDDVPADLREGINWIPLVLPDKIMALEAVKDQDWVIHSAGLISYKKKDKYHLLAANQEGTEEIVNACLTHGVQHLVYIGSIGALGRETDHVTVNEETPWVQNEFSTAYGLSKYLGELEVWRGASEGLNVSVVLPSVILGSGDWKKSSLQLFDRIVNKTPMYPGGQTGFVDVRDVARFTSLLLEKQVYGERWILSAASRPYREIYETFIHQVGIKRQFRPAPKWLAKLILKTSQALRGEGFGVDVINQAYGTFTYDGSKSQGLEDFQYLSLQKTLGDIARAYKLPFPGSILPFS